MTYKTDIEIARECKMLPVSEIARNAGIDEKYLEHYGRYKAKIDLSLIKEDNYHDRTCRRASSYR